MALGLGFPCKSFICFNPRACVSSRNPSDTTHFAAAFPSSTLTRTSSTRERLGTNLQSRLLLQWHFQSSGSWPLVRQNLAVPKKFHTCKRPSAAAGSSIDLSTNAKMEEEHSQEDDQESAITEPTSEAPEDLPEFRLTGDETELTEIGTSLLSIQTGKKVIIKIRDVGKEFVMNNIAGVVGLLRIGQKEPEPEVLVLRTSMIEHRDGVTAVHQWSATELTMQHDQLTRIAIDINYLVFAFAFFGWVRILEAILAVFSTNPPMFRRMMQSFNALDYLTIAWLAHNLRKPIISLLQVDPTDLQRVATLKASVWEELHAFFERQWKVMATVAVARFLSVVANHIPPSHWITKQVKLIWDMMMALPVF